MSKLSELLVVIGVVVVIVAFLCYTIIHFKTSFIFLIMMVFFALGVMLDQTVSLIIAMYKNRSEK